MHGQRNIKLIRRLGMKLFFNSPTFEGSVVVWCVGLSRIVSEAVQTERRLNTV